MPRCFASLLLFAILAGCASPAPSPPAAPPSSAPPTQGASGEGQGKAAPGQGQGQAAAGRGESGAAPGGGESEAVARLKARVEAEPSADNWNELSYAYLLEGQFEAAAEAGSQSLHLNGEHPYALYNTGVARLELGGACEAARLLERSAERQPERHEPLTALARAYIALGSHARARHAAGLAVDLAPEDPEAKGLVTAAAELYRVGAEKEGQAEPLWQGEAGTLSLLSRDAKKCDWVPMSLDWSRYTLIWEPANGPVQLLEFWGTAEGKAVAQEENGLLHFLLPGGPTGAGIARTSEWRLFRVRDGRLEQIIFPDRYDYFIGPRPDLIRSDGRPVLVGDRILTGHRTDTNGEDIDLTIARLLPDLPAAVTTGHYYGPRLGDEYVVEGQIVALGEAILVRGAGGEERGYFLSDGTRYMRKGQPVDRTALQMGMHVRLNVTDWPLDAHLVEVLDQVPDPGRG